MEPRNIIAGGEIIDRKNDWGSDKEYVGTKTNVSFGMVVLI